jgi:hypothetical protein
MLAPDLTCSTTIGACERTRDRHRPRDSPVAGDRSRGRTGLWSGCWRTGAATAGTLQFLGALVQREFGKGQVDRGDGHPEEKRAAPTSPASSPAGVRLVGGVYYYSSAWLDSTQPVLASAGAGTDAERQH